MDGVLNVNKPPKITSQTTVTLVKRSLGASKAGHAGTLDPNATGVLLVCLGKATRLFEALQTHEKEYVGTIRLGATTTTDDAAGEILRQGEVPPLERETILSALARFRGEIEQIPPTVSALKRQGERLYRLARRGVGIEPLPRRVTVHELELLELALPRLRVRVVCSRGTYIRSLARDIGEAFGCGGYLESLERTRSGPFRVEEAIPLREVLAHPDHARNRLMPLEEVLQALERKGTPTL